MVNPMFRKYVIAGSYAQYKAWLRSTGASSDAAVYLHDSADLRKCDVAQGEIELVGEYFKHPLYGSQELHQWLYKKLAHDANNPPPQGITMHATV